MLQVVRELILKLGAPDRGAPRPVPERVARLDHKLRDHAVEDHTLKVPAPCVADKVLHRLRRLLREKPQVHVAERRVDRRGVRDGRWPAQLRGRGRCDRLLFTRRALIEDVSVAGFVVPNIITMRTDPSRKGRKGHTYSGSERVKR